MFSPQAWGCTVQDMHVTFSPQAWGCTVMGSGRSFSPQAWGCTAGYVSYSAQMVDPFSPQAWGCTAALGGFPHRRGGYPECCGRIVFPTGVGVYRILQHGIIRGFPHRRGGVCPMWRGRFPHRRGGVPPATAIKPKMAFSPQAWGCTVAMNVLAQHISFPHRRGGVPELMNVFPTGMYRACRRFSPQAWGCTAYDKSFSPHSKRHVEHGDYVFPTGVGVSIRCIGGRRRFPHRRAKSRGCQIRFPHRRGGVPLRGGWRRS